MKTSAIFCIIVLISVSLVAPQQSFAQPKKYDGSKAYVTIWFDHAFLDQVPACNKMILDHIPGAILVRTGVVGNPEYMTWDQIHYYEDNGFEMIDHSVSHPVITNTTSQGTLVREILYSKQIIKTHGLHLTGYLSPYDLVTPNSAQLIDRNFKWTVVPSEHANTVDSIQNYGRLWGFHIPSLQHFGVGVPPGPPLQTFEDAKAQIDKAIAEHTWIVLNYHQLDDKKIEYHAKLALFMKILAYVKQKVDSKQMVAVTPSQGLGLR